MVNYKYLKVFFNDILVGTLVKTPDRVVAFEYDSDWLINGFSVSPFGLPLIKKVFIPKYEPFDGLFGFFNDSLPDGWGRLLVDRLFLKNKINPAEFDNFNRLAVVQENGMGALTYKPEHKFEIENKASDYDILAQECSKILESQNSDKTRIDCITNTHAAKFDFANKWAESIRQALHYQVMIGKKL